MIEDEFNLIPILSEHGCVDDKLLKALNSKFNNFCDTYMEDHESVRRSALTEMYCCLARVIISCEDDAELLKDSIEMIMKSCLKEENKND